MGTIKHFSELKIWQEARELNKLIYSLIIDNRDIKDWAIKDQVNRAAGSVMDNIAEGFGRGGNKEFGQFLSISLGSLSEVESQLVRANDRSYFDDKTFEMLEEQTKALTGMLISFMNYLRNSGNKAPKLNENPKPRT